MVDVADCPNVDMGLSPLEFPPGGSNCERTAVSGGGRGGGGGGG